MANEIESAAASEAPPEARVMKLEPAERDKILTKKATCPFLSSAIGTGQLPVRNEPGNPLASIQDVIDLGNTGGGDLGKVLGFFAGGNHGKMRGPTGSLDAPVPKGLFSLDLPGSQGSHAGHSGILQGDPTQLDSGRFSPADFERLAKKSQGGFIRRSDIARFIRENIDRDPNSKSFPAAKLTEELGDLSKALFLRSLHKGDDNTNAEIRQSLASILGSNNLSGSAGEFGLLLAFLHNSPKTRHEDDDPAFSMDEIIGMFRDKQLPEGWDTWKKTGKDWALHTSKLAGNPLLEPVLMTFVKLLA